MSAMLDTGIFIFVLLACAGLMLLGTLDVMRWLKKMIRVYSRVRFRRQRTDKAEEVFQAARRRRQLDALLRETER